MTASRSIGGKSFFFFIEVDRDRRTEVVVRPWIHPLNISGNFYLVPISYTQQGRILAF